MKSVEFSEEQLQDMQSLGDMLFADENDPRSWAYKRVLVRPKIQWLRVLAFVLLPIAVSLLLFCCIQNTAIAVICCVLVNLLYIACTAKRAAICLVKIYQRYAPDSIRNKCRFEPSCSVYMIASIEKYGFFAGIRKGIRRIQRCNVGDGGFDYP